MLASDEPVISKDQRIEYLKLVTNTLILNQQIADLQQRLLTTQNKLQEKFAEFKKTCEATSGRSLVQKPDGDIECIVKAIDK